MQLQSSSPNQTRINSLITAFGSIGMLATGALFFYVVNPVGSRILPPCPFLWATNCYCPGCGAARAFHSLARGDLGAAIGYNPLLVLSLPLFGYFYLSFLGGELFGRRLPFPTSLNAYAWLIPAIIILYWVLRNLPWEPFSHLAP